MNQLPATPADTPETDAFLATIPNSTQWYVKCRDLERQRNALRAESVEVPNRAEFIEIANVLDEAGAALRTTNLGRGQQIQAIGGRIAVLVRANGREV